MNETFQRDEQGRKEDTPKLLGGKVCLDFVNTLEPRIGDHHHEFLKNYADLIRWEQYVHILTDIDGESLLQVVQNRQAVAKSVYENAITLREAIYQTFFAIASKQAPSALDLEVINNAMGRRCIVSVEGRFVWDWTESQNRLERVLWPVAQSAGEIMAAGNLNRVKICPHNDGCGWLFFDSSKNGSRRYCSMEGCGNRARARRYYKRRRGVHEEITE